MHEYLFLRLILSALLTDNIYRISHWKYNENDGLDWKWKEKKEEEACSPVFGAQTPLFSHLVTWTWHVSPLPEYQGKSEGLGLGTCHRSSSTGGRAREFLLLGGWVLNRFGTIPYSHPSHKFSTCTRHTETNALNLTELWDPHSLR